MKKTIGILAIALLIGMALPALAQPPEGTFVTQGVGIASTNGFQTTSATGAAAESAQTVADAQSQGDTLGGGSTDSQSEAEAGPGSVMGLPNSEEVTTANTNADANGGVLEITDANANAVNADTIGGGTAAAIVASSGTSPIYTNTNIAAGAGPNSFTDVSGTTYTGDWAGVDGNTISVLGSSNSAAASQATENS